MKIVSNVVAMLVSVVDIGLLIIHKLCEIVVDSLNVLC